MSYVIASHESKASVVMVANPLLVIVPTNYWVVTVQMVVKVCDALFPSVEYGRDQVPSAPHVKSTFECASIPPTPLPGGL